MPKSTATAIPPTSVEADADAAAVKPQKKRKLEKTEEAALPEAVTEERAAQEIEDLTKKQKKKRKHETAAVEDVASNVAAREKDAATENAEGTPDERAGAEADAAPEAKLSNRQKKKAAQAKRKAEQKQAKAARNEDLKSKGETTRKEKYKAAKAEKKAAALEKQGQKSKIPCRALEEKALAHAGVEKLDPLAVSCFVTGLSYNASERHVQEFFAKAGACKVDLFRDPATGKSTGKAFLTFGSAQVALKASTFHGSYLQKRWIGVRLCQVRGEQRSAEASETGPGEKPDGCLSAVVSCDKAVTEDQLWAFFEDCSVSGIGYMTDKETGAFRGRAFLDFEDTDHVDKAIAKSGTSLNGALCFVRYKREKPGDKEKKAEKAEQARAQEDSGGGHNRIAEHNRAPPVPKPCGKATTFEESDGEEE